MSLSSDSYDGFPPPIWEVRISSPRVNITKWLEGFIDDVMNDVLREAYEEDIYENLAAYWPELSIVDRERAVSAAIPPELNSSNVDAREDFQGQFFTIRVTRPNYSILIAGFRREQPE